jgi:DNA-binding IclR family transcriptional regulator
MVQAALPQFDDESAPAAVPLRVMPNEPRTRPGPAESRGRGVVQGAFLLLEALAREGSAGPSRLAQLTGLPKTSVLRLLDRLVEVNGVERLSSGARARPEYRLGSAFARIGSAEESWAWLRRAAERPSRALAEATGAAVGIAILREPAGIGIEVIATYCPPDSAITSVVVDSGRSAPAATAAGQVLLAERLDLPGPAPFSDEEWRRLRADIRARGVAYEQQRFARGFCCVAAPVRGPDGRAIAALSAMINAETIPPGLAEQVRRTAALTGRRVALLGGPSVDK